MDTRTRFIVAATQGERPISQLCEQYGISRKTAYKWLDRYHQEGFAGLSDRGSARHTPPPGLAPEIVEAVLALRDARPTWGPRKLRQRLIDTQSATPWPAASTIGDLLRREQRSQPRQKSRRDTTTRKPTLIEPVAPNTVWAADFKGPFRTGDGVRCEPLTVSDSHSRYLLCCQAVPRVTFGAVQPLMIGLFETYGMPEALRTDNGNPFARRDGLGGLSRLSVWLLTLDIWPDFILPGRPDMNGRHERMHRVLLEDAADPPAATLADQQAELDAWRQTYNTERPHEALGQRTPASLYTASSRAYPSVIRPWDYPADHHVRRVIGDGHVRWRDESLYLSAAFRGQQVALAQRDDGDWVVRFRCFDLAVLSDRTNRLTARQLRRTRLVSAA
jgi:transposase InsO family protein